VILKKQATKGCIFFKYKTVFCPQLVKVNGIELFELFVESTV